MERGPWRALLILGLAVVARALAPQREVVSYEDAVSSAVQQYNREAGLGFAYRLLEAKAQQEWDSQKQLPQHLEFTVKETICPSSEQVNPEDCDFKDDGIVKVCSGTFIWQETASIILLNCEDVSEKKGNRVRRGVRKFFRKIKQKLQRFKPGTWSIIAHAGAHVRPRIA
uniref:Vipericidin n=1 Tax=Salvator merianae TaxID=96440 RepID=A0A8D0DUD6_SALMN